MTTFVRPTKIGGNQQYVDEVSSGYPELPASELDDDLNVLYDAVNRQIPNDSVGPPQIVDRSITYNQIALKTLTNGEIADKTITTALIANGAITTVLLDPNIVVPIQPLSITNAMLQNGCVSDSKVTSITWPKITGAPTSFPPSGPAGGDLAGTYPNPTARAGLIPTTLPPSGPAGGDLIGTYPNPLIGPGKVNRSKCDVDMFLPPVPVMPDEQNMVLTVSLGGQGQGIPTWQPAPPATLLPGQVTTQYLGDDPNGVTDAKITSVSWSKVTGPPTTYPPSGPAGGDLTGTYPNPTIRAGYLPTALPPSGPASGDLSGTYPAPLVRSGAISPAKLDRAYIESGAIAGGDLAGTYPAPTLRPGVLPTTLPPTGPAGGDLTGTYPNPTLLPAQKNLWQIAGATITPIDTTKTLALAPIANAMQWGLASHPVKGRVLGHDTLDIAYFTLNAALNAGSSGWVQDDAAKPSWELVIRTDTDRFQVNRQGPGGTPNANLLALDNGGTLAVNALNTGAGGVLQRSVYIGGTRSGPVGQDILSPGGTVLPAWMTRHDTDADTWSVWRQAPNAGAWAQPLIVRADGKTVCSLANGVITQPMMAAGASVYTIQTMNIPNNQTVNGGVWTTVASMVRTFKGSMVLAWCTPNMVTVVGSPGQLYCQIMHDGTGFSGQSTKVALGPANLPMYPSIGFDWIAAGSHTIAVQVYCSSGAITTGTDWAGSLNYIEFA